MGHEVKDGEPDANVLGSFWHRSSGLTNELLGIESDLHPVVEEGEERGKWKGGNEDGDEPKLQDWWSGKMGSQINTMSKGKTYLKFKFINSSAN